MIKVIYEDQNILVVHKPKKMLSHFTMNNKQLPNLLDTLRLSNGHVITRLDANTEGIVLIAKNSAYAQAFTKLTMKHQIQKKYHAISLGYFSKQSAIYEAYYYKDSEYQKILLSRENKEEFQRITTKIDVLEEKNGLSLLDIELITGKTHQIRAHCAFLGHPVLGDPLYGNPKINQKYQCKDQLLIAYSIRFPKIDEDDLLHPYSESYFKISQDPVIQYIKK